MFLGTRQRSEFAQKSLARDQAVGHFVALTIDMDHVSTVFEAPIGIGTNTGHGHACSKELAILEEESPLEAICENHSHSGFPCLIPFDAVVAWTKRLATFLSAGN